MLFSFLIILLIIISLINLLKITTVPEKGMLVFLSTSSVIVIWANILSVLHQLSMPLSWAAISLLTGILYLLLLKFVLHMDIKDAFKINLFPGKLIHSIKHWYSKTATTTEKIILTPLIFTFITIAIINLLQIIFSAPFTWDSMTYHLARMAYFLQHNSMGYYEANYWAQVVHPKNATSLMTYSYLLSGKNENFTQLIQYLSYLVSVISVYGISRKIGSNISQSIFSSLVAALLTNWLMQSITTQNDMIITAFVGISTYFIFSYQQSKRISKLWLSAISIGLMLGAKSSALVPIACIAFLTILLFFKQKSNIKEKFSVLIQYGLLTLLSITIFALPSGYYEDIQLFGNPLGPESVREMHSFEGASLDYIIKYGSINTLRYGFEFLSIDGFTGNFAKKTQDLIHYYPYRALKKLNIDIDTFEATRQPFYVNSAPVAQEDKSYWGIFGFTLIWIAVLIQLFSAKRSPKAFFLALISLAFFLLQSFSSPYDPWRGRYFIICAIFAGPLVGSVFSMRKIITFSYILLITILGCMSAFSAIFFRDKAPILICTENQCAFQSILQQDRIERLTATRPDFYKTITKFDEIVPADATVALMLPLDSYEYPLFGNKLTRELIPINSFYNGPQQIPDNADYLLYTSDLMPEILSTDIPLGQNWYIRDLSN